MVLARYVLSVIPEFQRAVFFRFGRVIGEPRGPGLVFKIPIVDKVVRVNLRVEVVDIPSQSVITQDNVTISVDAVVYFQVVDPVRAVIGVDNFRFASQRIAMTSLRSIIGRYELDSLLAHREDVNSELRATIARSTAEWGVEVRQVEIRDVTLPPELLRAMARQAEAERERRARIITADGEMQASQKLSQAAATMADTPTALQLRLLQTVVEVAAEKTSTVILPFPVELLRFLESHTSQIKPEPATTTRAAPALAGESRLDELRALLEELLDQRGSPPGPGAVEPALSPATVRGIAAAEASPPARQRESSDEQPNPSAQPLETA